MADSSGSQGLSYMPEPFEQAYYSGLFNAADTEQQRSIGGANAVQFFSRSKLPVDFLKSVWAAADNPSTNSLDHRKFAVAVRLIQLAQNGKKGQGVNLETAPGVPLRPVFFEGISGVSVPMPQQQQPSPVPVQQQQKQPLPQSPKQNQQIVSPNQRQFVAQPPMQQQNANQYGQPQSPLRQPIQGPDMVQNSQHQPSTPPRPPHPQINVGGAVMRSVALTVQDPYTLTPSEQARYEQLFGDFAKSDGYCYGPEAVGLFGKSGLPQPQLAAIWNMVDNPVDNRLDKLEFAIAMHLIVCVTKKNLPFPPALPLPLKQLKSQLPPSQVSNASSINLGMAQQTQRTSAADGGAISISGAGTKTPMVNTGMQGVDSNYSVDGGSNFGIGGGEAGFQSGMQHGRMGSIDSLGGNLGPSGMQGPPPLQPSGGASISDAFEGLVGSGDSESVSTYRPPTPPMQVSNVPENKNMYSPEPMVMPVVSNSLQSPAKNMKASVNRPGDSVGDMEQLRGALQKLQAENISLKAKLSTMAGEEDDVRKELMETVTEITTLSSQLTTLRAQVLGAKSRLLEVTGELSAAKEKKSVITDLIAETKATKLAINEASESLEEASRATNIIAPPALAFETDLFDWGKEEVAAPVAAPAPSSTQIPPASYPSSSSFDNGSNYGSNSYGQPEAVTSGESQSFYTNSNYGQPDPIRSSESNKEPESQNNYNQAAPNNAFTYNYGGASAQLEKSDLNRDTSLRFGEVMGSGSDLRSLMSGSVDTHSAYNEGVGDVNELTKKAKSAKDALREAESVAVAAEESKQQLLAQADELRRLADEAEKEARDAAAKSSGKKKGVFGRGQKLDIKEAEKLALDAKDKKEAFLEAQSQVNDAQSLASETRRETERLRKAAEDLDIKLASAASMQKPAPQSVPSASNGFPSQAPSYGFGTLPPTRPASNDGFGSQSYGVNGGFNANVMGNKGLSIPTPSGADDPYGNPFG